MQLHDGRWGYIIVYSLLLCMLKSSLRRTKNESKESKTTTSNQNKKPCQHLVGTQSKINELPESLSTSYFLPKSSGHWFQEVSSLKWVTVPNMVYYLYQILRKWLFRLVSVSCLWGQILLSGVDSCYLAQTTQGHAHSIIFLRLQFLNPPLLDIRCSLGCLFIDDINIRWHIKAFPNHDCLINQFIKLIRKMLGDLLL